MSTLILPYPSTHPDLCHGKYVAGLFANGEQGAWYDPSDFSTMYQDAAGKIPVTAVGQPVGLILDKSAGLQLGQNESTNPSYDNGLGNTQFGNPGLLFWDSINQRAVLERQTSNYPQLLVKNTSVGSGVANNKWYLIEADITNISITTGSIYVNSNLNLSNYVISYIESIPVGTTKRTKFLVFWGYSNTPNYWLYIQLNNANVGGQIAVDNVSIRKLSGNHAFQPSTTKRPILRVDSDGKHYLEFDGVDDYLVTPNINFTSTDKMTVFAGVRKLNSNTGARIVAELSNSSFANNGAFGLFAPIGIANDSYAFQSRGTAISASTVSTYISPITNVLAGVGDISGDLSNLRVNGAQVAQSTADQGTGNYGNYPLYIGSRGGTDFRFNGHLYGLIVCGAQTDSQHITNVERYLANKSGVVL